MMKNYAADIFNYQRYKSREVKVGDLGFGGDNPIRIQSMTTTDTMDTMATVEQSIRMIEAGCELVRITAPSIKEAKNLQNIKAELLKRGYNTPLVADIHYTPKAAEIAAGLIEKVRVNPGNYADKKRFDEIEYTEESYQNELKRIRERFTPLVEICKQHGTAMRIGTNHGSLSDRILSRFGDTPLGMVESALEFVRICEDLGYHQLILSMKASNPKIMIEAYRWLVVKMQEEGMNYPLHLGVTEAGEGEDGRIKSAVGIGTLLEDGLGDTIRVSLTEEPEFEMPVAIKLKERYSNRKAHRKVERVDPNPINPFEYDPYKSNTVLNIGDANVPRVISDFSNVDEIDHSTLVNIGYIYEKELDKWTIKDNASDFIYLGNHDLAFEIPGTLGVIYDLPKWDEGFKNSYPLLSLSEYQSFSKKHLVHFLKVEVDELKDDFIALLKKDLQCVLVLYSDNEHAMPHLRSAFMKMINHELKNPVILYRDYSSVKDPECVQLYASTDFGGILNEGLGQGIWLKDEILSSKERNSLAFGILQATRTRISKTEYISCPSCGRTLFDLQETTAKVRAKTQHLKGLKIGIMGCIVNGPGEMADADYGYVGTGKGLITLYKEKEVVKKNIASESAVDELIELIRSYGDWIDPS
jgi:(E)-4-hydroxy-3-methylbut-2-enyl-diphosphate synthase